MNKSPIKNFVFDKNKEISLAAFVRKFQSILNEDPTAVIKMEVCENDVLMRIFQAAPSRINKLKQPAEENKPSAVVPTSSVVTEPKFKSFYKINENFTHFTRIRHHLLHILHDSPNDMMAKIFLTCLEIDYFHDEGCISSKAESVGNSTRATTVELFENRDKRIIKLIELCQIAGYSYGKEKAFTPGPNWCIYFKIPYIGQLYWRTNVPNTIDMKYINKDRENYSIKLYERIMKGVRCMYSSLSEHTQPFL